jgi:hypothetical protein
LGRHTRLQGVSILIGLSVLGLATLLGAGASSAGAEADPCPNASFRTGFGALLPDCRAYEQVSPVDKGGFDIAISNLTATTGGPAAPDGSAVAFKANGAFAGARYGGAGFPLPYLSRRDATGWRTVPLHPRPLDQTGLVPNDVEAFTPDLGHSILRVSTRLGEHPPAGNNFYLQENATGALAHMLSFSENWTSSAASSDLSHFVVTTSATLTADPGLTAEARKVYEWVDGQLRLVSRQPGSNEPFGTESVLGSNENVRSQQGAVSDDGRHVFFTVNSDTERKIYRRTDGAETTLVSPSKRSAPDPDGSKGKVFVAATDDGNRVFFRSPEQLTDDANSSATATFGDLYRYDVAADELIDLSAGTEGSTPADVESVVAFDEAGDRVYFVAEGQVVPGSGVEGQSNLYLWEDDGSPAGAVRYIATLDPVADRPNWSWEAVRSAQATPDGSGLVFQSVANVTAYDAEGTRQVYLYDAEAAGGDGELLCLSCDPDGPPAGASSIPTNADFGGRLGAELPASITDDGSRVLFSSPNSIAPRDGNGEHDAYLWEEGETSPISTAASPDDSYAYTMSRDGDDVFFRTRQQLVPQDVDHLIDLYTAHVGGGLASQQEPAVEDCEGEDCKGEPSAAPPVGMPATLAGGGGNVATGPDCAALTRRARGLRARARTLRRQARDASAERARLLRGKATRLARHGAKQGRKARRCRRDAGGGR